MHAREGEIRRVVSILLAVGRYKPELEQYCSEALHRLNSSHCKTEGYLFLREVADYFNPYKSVDPRRLKKCMIAAYARREHQACIAATFYLLSEGLYNNPRLPDLTNTVK